MTATPDSRMSSLPSVVVCAILFLVVAFAIAPFRVAIKYDWTHLDRVAFTAIVSLGLAWLVSKALLKARKWAWWVVVLGTLSRAIVVLLELTVVAPGYLTPAVPKDTGELLGAQYAFEFAVFVLLLHPEARRWFNISLGAKQPSSGVA